MGSVVAAGTGNRSANRPPDRSGRRVATRSAGRSARGSARASAGGSGPPATWSLPGPLRWLIWLGAAALLSVLAGFAVGLARPRVKAA